jgi:hypothetical protein
MELDRYYSLLNVKEGDRIIVDSKDSLILGMYIAGQAKKTGLRVSVQVIVKPDSPILSDMDAVSHAKTSFQKEYGTIAEGATLITFSVGTLAAFSTNNIFNKAIISRDDTTDIIQTLSKVSQITTGEKLVLFDLSFEFFRKFVISRKQMFGEKKEIMSFRQLLASLGMQIGFYDAIGSRLLCLCNAKSFDAKFSLSTVDFSDLGDMIRKEIFEYIVYSKPDALYSIESGDKEYLYFIQNEKTENQPISCQFIFLDGKADWSTPESQKNSRNFIIVVLPNTDAFRKELEGKEILIITKEKAFELYGEEVEPY